MVKLLLLLKSLKKTEHTKSVLIFSLLRAMLIGFDQEGFGQIVAWDFNSNAGSETTVNSTTTNTNLNSSVISKGSGLSNPSGANAFSGSFGAVGYSTGTTSLATAITAQEYLQFTISVKAGFKVSLSTLNANFLRSTNNAPNSFQWQYSLNAFGTAGVNIGSTISYTLYTTGTASNGTVQTQINLSSIASGGQGSYYFSTDNGSSWTASSYPLNFTFTRLSAGVQYKIRVKDSNGCTSPAINQVKKI